MATSPGGINININISTYLPKPRNLDFCRAPLADSLRGVGVGGLRSHQFRLLNDTTRCVQSDLYTCGQVFYWNNYVLKGNASSSGDMEAALGRISNNPNGGLDLTLAEEITKAKADYAANKTNAAVKEIADMTATRGQWVNMVPPTT